MTELRDYSTTEGRIKVYTESFGGMKKAVEEIIEIANSPGADRAEVERIRESALTAMHRPKPRNLSIAERVKLAHFALAAD